jgi:hypothetical protein
LHTRDPGLTTDAAGQANPPETDSHDLGAKRIA